MRRLIRQRTNERTSGCLEEVRRYGWLRDYHHELDQGPDRSISAEPVSVHQSWDRPKPQQASPPVIVNVNINLGDMLSRLVTGESSTREALEEIVREPRATLTEDDYEDDKDDQPVGTNWPYEVPWYVLDSMAKDYKGEREYGSSTSAGYSFIDKELAIDFAKHVPEIDGIVDAKIYRDGDNWLVVVQGAKIR